MKRTITLVLVLVFILALVGCAPKATNTSPATASTAASASSSAPSTAPSTAPASAAASSTAPAGNAPATIKIGCDLALTGDASAFANFFKFAYQYDLDKINAGGGVFVKQYNKKIPLELVIGDSQSKPDVGAQQAERLMQQEHVVAYLNAGGPLYEPVAGAAERNKVPTIGLMVAPLFMKARSDWKYAWDMFPDISDATSKVFGLLDTFGTNKKIAIVSANDSDGLNQVEVWTKLASSAGYTIVYKAMYPVGTTDFTDVVRKCQASGADILLEDSLTPDGIAMWKQMQTAGWKPKAAQVVRAADSPEFANAVGNGAMEGLINATFWTPQSPFPDSADKATQFTKQYKMPWSSFVASPQLAVIAKAIELAGSLDPDAINAQIPAATAAQPYTMGNLKFDGHVCLFPMGITQYFNGEQVIVYPKEMAGKAPQYPIPAWK